MPIPQSIRKFCKDKEPNYKLGRTYHRRKK